MTQNKAQNVFIVMLHRPNFLLNMFYLNIYT